MATKDKTDCTGVNIGLIIAIVFLLILTIVLGTCYEGFNNIFPNYDVPKVNDKVPNLQKMTVPIFAMAPDGTPVVVPTEVVVDVNSNVEAPVSSEMIEPKVEMAEAPVDSSVEKVEHLRSTRVNRPPQARRVNTRATARPRAQQRRTQQGGAAGRR